MPSLKAFPGRGWFAIWLLAWPSLGLATRSPDNPPCELIPDEVVSGQCSRDIEGLLAARRPRSRSQPEGFVSVSLNGWTLPDALFVMVDPQQRILIAECDLPRLGVALPSDVIDYAGLPWVDLKQLPGADIDVDLENLSLHLTLPIEAFCPTTRSLQRMAPATPTPLSTGFYSNYRIQYDQQPQGRRSAGLVLDAAGFGSFGFVQSSHRFRQVNGYADASRQREHQRLESRWILDFPNQLSTLTIGDVISAGSAAADASRFAGVQYQRNFDLDPSFSPLQTLTFRGEARVPSTVELLLDDRRLAPPQAVPPGAFSLEGLPMLSGTGTITVLITDALGNERGDSLRYFSSPRLLASGVYAFSYSAGWQRVALDRYEGAMVSTVHAYGLSDGLTVRAAAAAEPQRRALAGGFDVVLWRPWVLSVDTAVRQHTDSDQWGQRWALGLAHEQSGGTQLGLTYRQQDRRFALADGLSPERSSLTAFAARQWASVGTISLSHSRLSRYDDTSSGRSTRQLSTLSFSRSLAQSLHLQLSVLRSDQDLQALLSLSLSLGAGRHLSTQLSGQQQRHGDGQQQQANWRYQQNLPTDEGWGHYVGQRWIQQSGDDALGPKQNWRHVAGAQLRRPHVDHQLDLDHSAAGTAWRWQSAGAVGVLGGQRFNSRVIDGAFAVVSTGEVSDLPIHRDHVPVTRSNARGVAVLNRLRPYQTNPIRLPPEALPMQYRLRQFEQSIVPTTRGGVLVSFEVEHDRSALLLLVDEHGQPLPQGTPVWLRYDQVEQRLVLGRQGRLYVDHLPQHWELSIASRDHECELLGESPSQFDRIQPQLGPYVCPRRPSP